MKPPNFFTGQFSLCDNTFLSVYKLVEACVCLSFLCLFVCAIFFVFMRGAGLPLGVVPPM